MEKFRGRAVCAKTTPILGARTLYTRVALALTRGFSWVNISWFASRPRKLQKYYPPKNTRFTVYQECLYRSIQPLLAVLPDISQFSGKSLKNSPEMQPPLIDGRNVSRRDFRFFNKSPYTGRWRFDSEGWKIAITHAYNFARDPTCLRESVWGVQHK